jgi:ABC-type transport system substrate-binding protein
MCGVLFENDEANLRIGLKERKEKEIKLRNKTRYIVATTVTILLISTFTVFPVNAFIYPNGGYDNKYELYGPHADQMRFQFYAGEDAMFTALQTGQIDLTDSPLTMYWRTQFASDPNIQIVSAGGEAGFYTVDFNMDKYKYVPNSIRAPYPNNLYVDPPGIPPISTNVFFRIGVSALFNRTKFNALVGAAGQQILTPVPSYMTATIWPGAYAYQYSRVQAEANFTAGYILQDKTTSPWTRYWDYNHNGIVDTGEKEAAKIVITWRSTEYRRSAGEQLYAELLAMNFTAPSGAYAAPPAKIGGMRTSATNYQQVMLDKNYHITTLGWIFIGPDPDFLYDLYNPIAFWDDAESSCSNTADLNDTVLNHFEEMIKFNTTSGGALQSAHLMQERFIDNAFQIPLYSSAAYSGSRKWYSGGNAETIVSPDDGENIYRGNAWLHLCAQQGLGSNSWFSYLNGYPNGSLYGNGFMTIRYGWREQGMPQHINPFYSEWYWDSIILGAIYDTPGYRNPYDLTKWEPVLIKNWTTGTWTDTSTSPSKTKSKVTMTLRPDMKWMDGTPITMADVVFSLVEAGPLMISRGFSPPWWWPTGELVKSLTIIDPYTVEILYNVQSYLVQSWTLGGIYVVPKHIWKPIILSPSGPTGFTPDPNVIGSGPWRYKSLTALVGAVLVANKPDSLVITDRPGAVAITSPGFYNYYPKYVNVHVTSPTPFASKLNTATFPLAVGLEVDIKNWDWMDSMTVNKYVYVDGVLQAGYPTNPTIAPAAVDVETLSVNLARGKHTVKVAVHIKGPSTVYNGKLGQANPWISHWDNVTLFLYVTRMEDITGSTLYDDMGLPLYPYKTELPSPDSKVELKDLYAAGKAFGSTPGSPKWNSVADINHDYKVELKDYYAIAKAYNK